MKSDVRDKSTKVIIVIYCMLLLVINAIRIPMDNFWADEAFTALMANRSFARIIANTAMDVHPPLYYFITKIAIMIFGNEPWVFRIVSFVPYLLMMCWGIRCVAKKWGYISGVLFITLISITKEALLYNVQVRMYTWTAFFLLLVFEYICRIINKENSKDYILLTFFSLCAAYTHYYGLIPVFFLYIGIIIILLVQKKRINKILLSGVTVAILYTPWLVVLIRTMSRLTSDGYWITNTPSARECIKYLIPLNNKYMQYIALLFILYILLNNIYLCIIVKKKYDENAQMYILGMISVLATIFTGEIVSLLFFPAFIERYMYPIAVVFWLLISVLIGEFLRGKKIEIVAGLVVFCFIVIGNISSFSGYIKSIRDNAEFHNTKAIIDDCIGESEIITDDSTTVCYWYYHDNECNVWNKENVTFDKTRYIAILTKTTMEELANQMKGYSVTEKYHNGIFGTKNVDIYLLEKQL